MSTNVLELRDVTRVHGHGDAASTLSTTSASRSVPGNSGKAVSVDPGAVRNGSVRIEIATQTVPPDDAQTAPASAAARAEPPRSPGDAGPRADLVTLGAVGASPRTRRVLSSSRAGVIAGIGAVLGTAAGFVPAYAWVRSERGLNSYAVSYNGVALPDYQLRLAIPWLPLLAALIGIPLLAALVAGVFSRSRLPSERPAADT